jgi:hypothetical protein
VGAVAASRFDVVANTIAYAPLGFLVALVPAAGPRSDGLPRDRRGAALSVDGIPAMFLPPRDARCSISRRTRRVGIGAHLAVASRWPRPNAWWCPHGTVVLPGRVGDLCALLVICLAVQVNPGIPLFATIFDPMAQVSPAAALSRRPTGGDLAAARRGNAQRISAAGVGLS